MRRLSPSRWVALLILAFLPVIATARGEDGFAPEYRASEAGAKEEVMASLATTSSRSPVGQSAVQATLPDPIPHWADQALPQTGEAPSAPLEQRVAELERRLAEQAANSGKAAPPAPAKPLISPSGRIQFDATNFSQNANSVAQFGDVRNAVGFRRARIALQGEYKTLDYIIEMDFTGRGGDTLFAANTRAQQTGFKDVFIQMRDLPAVGNLRVGHFRECFGLEQLTGDSATMFMERSVCDEGTFVPGRNNGIMAFDWTESQTATWQAGVFTNQTGFDQPPLFQFDRWGLDFATRVTYLPWYDEASGGRCLLHTGFGYAYRSAPDYTANFAIRPEDNFGPTVISLISSARGTQPLTGVDHWQVFDLESAIVHGPLSLQSELFALTLERQSGAGNAFYGAYASLSCFLTGENRQYNRKMGSFERMRPYEEFFRVRAGEGAAAKGMGAWEVGYRFSYIDMLDGLTQAGAGRVADHTVGLNWYLNAYARVMFNYVHSQDTYNRTDTTRISNGNMDMFMMRMAMDF